MNTNPTPGDGGTGGRQGPADLAELKAIDALLDRLARGDATVQDRQDPLVEALARMRAALDDPLEQDAGEEISRLMDVLGERPLYLVADGTGQATPEDQPIWLGDDEPAGVVVDLTDPRLDSDRDSDRDSDQDGDPDAEPARPAAVIALPRQRAGWQRVLANAALPAASVALLVALGSGVSAAVTGNLMSPVTGVGRVVSQLPGVDGQPSTEQTVTSAQDAIVLASQAAHAHQRQRAESLLKLAQRKVAQLPPVERQQLDGQIAQVKQTLRTGTSPAMPTPKDPGVVVPKPTSPPPDHTTSPTTPATTAPTTTSPTTTTSPGTPSPSASTTPPPSATSSAPANP